MTQPTDFKLETPVALIIFNRPEETRQVFQRIAAVQPKKLFVIADGPREGRHGEVSIVEQTRSIIDQVNWDCSVYTNYSDENLGCGLRVSSGLDWVFEHTEAAIILEDDCVPHPTFFRYCEELLEKYRDNPEVSVVTGTNYLNTWKTTTNSYHFSRFGSIWGWASWQRAWRQYDFRLEQWNIEENRQKLRRKLDNPEYFIYWSHAFDQITNNRVDTWDYQWTYAYMTHGLTIVPSVNLIKNIGFGADATHTTSSKMPVAKLKLHEMRFPLEHPSEIKLDERFDEVSFKRVWGYRPSLIARGATKLRRMFADG